MQIPLNGGDTPIYINKKGNVVCINCHSYFAGGITISNGTLQPIGVLTSEYISSINNIYSVALLTTMPIRVMVQTNIIALFQSTGSAVTQFDLIFSLSYLV